MRKCTDLLVLATLVLVFILFNAAWLWHFRHGQLLDIDEAGYIGFALNDYQSLAHGGFAAFLMSVEAPSIQAPLTTALAGLAFTLTGPHILAAFSIPVFAGAGCILAAFFLARTLGMGRLSLVPALLVASCPLVLNFSRDFQFSMPAAFTSTASLACLLQSQRLTRPGWSVLFGVFLGLMPLSRTMTLAFLPALLAGAVVYAYAGPPTRWRWKTLWLAVALLAALLVAASWFVPNGRYVFHYLTGFGYGRHAAQYNQGQYGIGLSSFIYTIQLLGEYVCLPQFLLLLAAVPVAALIFIHASIKTSLRRAIAAFISSPVIPGLAFVAGVLLTLSSTANKGDGFIAPAVPAMLVLACLAFQTLCREALYRAVYVAVAVLIAAFGILPASGVPSLAQPIRAVLPVLGSVKVTSASAPIQAYEVAGQYSQGNWSWPISPAKGRQYAGIYEQAAQALSGQSAAVGLRGLLFNSNEILLYQEILGVPKSLALFPVDPVAVGATPEGVSSWLTVGQAKSACYLVLTDEVIHQFPPAIPPNVMQEGARTAGFSPSGTEWVLPDGERLTLWRRGNCA